MISNNDYSMIFFHIFQKINVKFYDNLFVREMIKAYSQTIGSN